MSPPRDSAARSVSTRLPVIASDGRWRNVERTEVVETSHQRLEGAGPSIGLPALSGAGRRNRTCSLPLTRRLLGLLSFPGDDGSSEEHTSELQSLMRISYAVFRLKKIK